MSIILLQVFVSLMLVAGSLVLFIWTVRSRTFDHADRLSLAPLEDDSPRQQQQHRKD
jgi:cbb3-type cytochrome oxidase maturation protein